ncbi:MAG: pyridoxamine 5'-phosphate oxidase [Rickettsiales bacterium]|jgi:pyridoxamine 5'-phosphate oxidase|nr:pyridoxamine 5'-phosphate oxidase [Rickettsiales bacterium]
MTKNPITQFQAWLNAAAEHPHIIEPTAMCLATADKSGEPSARMVLLKEVDERGFVFYTNDESHKGHDLRENPRVALVFYWMPLKRQIRVEGIAEKVSDEESDAYFNSRPRDSRIGAWASKQSRPLKDKAQLVADVARETARFGLSEIPRPPYWYGWRVVPKVIEFWEEGLFRIHDREVFSRSGEGWEITRLYP